MDGRHSHGSASRCRRFAVQPFSGTTSSGAAAPIWPCSMEVVRCSLAPNGLPTNGFERLQIFSAGSVLETSICRLEMTSSESESSISNMCDKNKFILTFLFYLDLHEPISRVAH